MNTSSQAMGDPQQGRGAARNEELWRTRSDPQGAADRNHRALTPSACVAHHLTEGTGREGKWEPVVQTRGVEVRKERGEVFV